MTNQMTLSVRVLAQKAWTSLKSNLIYFLILSAAFFVTNSTFIRQLNAEDLLSGAFLGPAGFCDSRAWFVIMSSALMSRSIKALSAEEFLKRLFFVLGGSALITVAYILAEVGLEKFALSQKEVITGTFPLAVGFALLVVFSLSYPFMRISLGLYLAKSGTLMFVWGSWKLTRGATWILFKSIVFLVCIAGVFYGIEQLKGFLSLDHKALAYAVDLGWASSLYLFCAYIILYYEALAKALKNRPVYYS